MIELEIDGKSVSVAEGTTIIEAADQVGIYIPRFCYHKKLSIAANCRMCLIDVEKLGKPQPACATPVTAGMKVFTQTEKALSAQRSVMEFLLINHPLDCPICDQGGECELQDLSLGFGRGYSNYREPKRAVSSENIGPLIETEMTRCIHCTRCVRFGEEVAGLRELGATGRGEDMEIGTYVKHFMRSELSGNIIDLCPVGALTNKPARYQGRAWEYREHPHISPHDCLGTNLFIHSRAMPDMPQRKVIRVVPRENETINETWMSDRDRYSCHALYHANRVYQPRIKQNNQWVEISWDEAFARLAEQIKDILQQHGAEQIAALASPNATLEEFYLLQKLLRNLGSNHIDHRVRWQDFRDQQHQPLFPALGMDFIEIDSLDHLLLIGAHIRAEQPLLGYRLIKLTADGGKIHVINPRDYLATFAVETNCIVSPQLMVEMLAEITKVLADQANEKLPELEAVIPSEKAKIIANALKEGKKCAIILGALALQHAEASQIRALTQRIAQFTQAKMGCLTEGANSAGAWLAGAIPHRGAANQSISNMGLDAKALCTTHPKRAYFLLNIEPELDTAYPEAALHTLKQAELTMCLTTFVNPTMEAYANFILPIAPFTETDGTYVNIEGQWQSFAAVSVPEENSLPAWRILCTLAKYCGLDGFNFKTAHEVRDTLKQQLENHDTIDVTIPPLLPIEKAQKRLMRLTEWPIYRVDALVRRSQPLQEAAQQEFASVGLNPKTAEDLQLTEGDWVALRQHEKQIVLPVIIDVGLADDLVYVPAGFTETAGFGTSNAEIILTRRSIC